MDFERKAEVNELLAEQDPDVKSMVLDSEAAPLFAEEPAPGPVPALAPERDKPDENALTAWVDDLHEFEQAHAGDAKTVEAVDKLKSALLDDLSAAERQRMLGADINANDEQLGMVADFHADLAIEGAALEVPPHQDPYLMPVADRPNPYIVDEYGGGGGGGGGGAPSGGPPAGGGGGGGDPDAPDDKKKDKPEPAKDKDKDKKGIWPFGRKDKPTDAPPPTGPDKKDK